MSILDRFVIKSHGDVDTLDASTQLSLSLIGGLDWRLSAFGGFLLPLISLVKCPIPG